MKRLLLLAALVSLPIPAGAVGDGAWVLGAIDFTASMGSTAVIRAGYLPESSAVPFRGNILHFQGFADSMRNHDPLFRTLASAGYRVIAFDYPGQGGSTGDMNFTKVAQISRLGDIAWERFARSGGGARKIVLGWSVGGLAAYSDAYRARADAVVLIAPALSLRPWIHEDARITVSALTSAQPAPGEDPHVDPLKPSSPVYVPLFAAELVATALAARAWTISPAVRGLVVLAGHKDQFIATQRVRSILRDGAPHFEVLSFPDARHEIDNEVPTIAAGLRRAVLDFLKRVR